MARETFQSATLKPQDIWPRTAQRILLVGCVPPWLACRRNHAAEKIWAVDGVSSASICQILEHGVDCILLGAEKWTGDAFGNAIAQLIKGLKDNGQITVLFNACHELPWRMDQWDQILCDHGMMRYREGYLNDAPKKIPQWGCVAVKSTYNPVAHSRDVAASGRPDGAIAILDAIPETFIKSKDLLARLALEKQRYYYFWQKKRGPQDPLHALFSKERREFAQVTALEPHMVEAYHVHAQYWAYLGRTDMARRVWRSIGHVCPDIRSDHLFPAQVEVAVKKRDTDAAPLWNHRHPPPRILIITHDDSDYGMDTLYHGLCTLLGKQNVVEYPWKPTLHGQNFEAAHNYPCVFNYPGGPESVDQLVKELRQGKFDLMLYGDVVQMAYADEVRCLINANADIPVILYDTWDDCFTPLQRVLKYIGRSRFDVVFKREMLEGVDYGPGTFPLPFGYVESLTHVTPKRKKSDVLFWAGKNEYGLRPLYVASLEKRLGCSLEQRYDQAAYQSKLASSQIGLSFFGCGFDSVRFWELPANGVMLMGERPPIRIPHNFVDGESAVFFHDLPEMEAKLDYYMHRPEEVARIAAAGHVHYLKHHTTVSRARQLLGIVDRELNGRLSKPSSLKKPLSPLNNKRGMGGKIYLGLVSGENYGWGVCSKYLIHELSKSRSVCILKDEDHSASNPRLEGKLFQALTDVEFSPLFDKARGSQNYGYTFFENELTAKSVENARRYDLVLAGSTWCLDRMLEKGISNCKVLIQGVDPALFYPTESETPQDRFVIFSGGKFELRKGQDLVLRAVKILQDKYPDVYLVNSWYNLWSESIRQMTCSPHITFSYNECDSWIHTMERTYHDNGLDHKRIVTLELVPHHQQPELIKHTDIGVFPNRCEGGTNLVLMEYMACAKPVIASYTSGHRDILTEKNALLLRHLKDMEIKNGCGTVIGRWQNPSVEELVAQLEYAYHHRDILKGKARQAGEDLRRYTWKRCAERLATIIES